MNPFTSIPKLISVVIGANRFNRHIPEIKRLQAAGDIEGEKEEIRKGQEEAIDYIAPRLTLTFDVTVDETLPQDGDPRLDTNHQSHAAVRICRHR